MKKILVLVIVFLFAPFFALADTTISGAITGDTTWSPAGGVYILDTGFSVSPGATLTINPGTIIKVKTMGYYWPSIYGKIIAHGTSEAPIIFTSFWDDSVGGDTNGDGPSVGAPGEWQGLYFKPGSEGSFDYVNFSYSGMGGYGNGDYVGIENDGGTLNIKHSNIHDNYVITSNGADGIWSLGSGIYNKSGTLSVSDSVIDNNVVGIRIDSGTATISGNVIKNNVDSTGYGPGYGVYAEGSEPLTLLNNTFVGNRRTAHVSASKIFIHSGNTSEDIINRGFEMGGVISNDTTFTSGDLPYIIQGLTISDGKTLTLEPGTILKMNDYYSSGSIVVRGNLIAKGTPEKKIYITSLKDDSIGSDTNGDGDATAPAKQDWASITFENGSKVDFDNVIVRYGGYRNYSGWLGGISAAIYDLGADFSMTNSFIGHNYGDGIFQGTGSTTIIGSEIADNNNNIQFRGGSMTVSQSSLHGSTGMSIYNESGADVGWGWEIQPLQIIDAKNNWWGDPSGPNNIYDPNPTGTGDEISSNVDYIPFLTAPPDFSNPPPPPPTIDPVIIIPGIVGTELYNGNDLIWMNLDQMFVDINDQFLTNNLNLDNQGNSINDIQIGNVIKEKGLSRFGIDIFKSLIQNIETDGYQENQNLFFFPYDWRLDLNTTKDLLNQKIDEVKVQTGKSKVNIIAHSMGGLLAKEYLNSYGKDSVNKIIFVGTPHLGAPKAGKILLEGDRFGIPWLEEDRIQEIAQNSPALHELLPNQTYFNQFQGYFRKYSLFSTNPLMNYGETKNFFLNNKNENPVMFEKAENFYNQNLDNFDFSGIETYNIAGCKTPTQAAYSFDIFNEVGQTGYTSGDGTVPMVSADYINIPLLNKFYVKDGNHAELPSTNGVRDLILGILGNNVNNLALNISNDSSFCNFKGKKLTWHSPVEIHIYSNGNHTGPIENNAIEYGVPGIDYDVMSHNKFIFLPTDNGQEYQVEAKGLGEGSFDLSISEIDNGQYLTTQVFNDVPVTTTATASLVINNLENNSLELEDGGVTKEVIADTTLNGETTLDLTPPETTAKTHWVRYKKENMNIQVTLEAIDNESGILKTFYFLEGDTTFNVYSKPIIIEGGVDKILFYSIDKAGNNEGVKEFYIEKTKPNK